MNNPASKHYKHNCVYYLKVFQTAEGCFPRLKNNEI